MATVSFISPKLMLNKLAEAIYSPINEPQNHPTPPLPKRSLVKMKKEQQKKSTNTNGNKLNVSVEDVKIISASLIHYKKFLARKKQLDKAEEVGEVDKKFMSFIQALEGIAIEEETASYIPPVPKPQPKPQPKLQKTLKRTLIPQDFDPDKEYKTPKLPQETLQTEWVVKKPKTKKRSASQFVR